MSTILGHVQAPATSAYVVFHAFAQAEYAPLTYYEILTLDEVRDPQTILAYEMNWTPLPIPHGAPVACASKRKRDTRWSSIFVRSRW
jgi:DMSO/TMAO reductase YedYZ molybdopterin-dependent catalytic subunit